MADVEQKPELQPNSFLTVLQRKELQESLLTEASRLLAELALAVKQMKKKGTLALTLTVEPMKGGAISIAANLALKAPSTAPQHLTIFFVGKDGEFTRNNPDQKELGLTSHDGGQATASENEESIEEEAQA